MPKMFHEFDTGCEQEPHASPAVSQTDRFRASDAAQCRVHSRTMPVDAGRTDRDRFRFLVVVVVVVESVTPLKQSVDTMNAGPSTD